MCAYPGLKCLRENPVVPGDSNSFTAYPALKRWAILFCARGAGLMATQTIATFRHGFVNSVLTQTLKSWAKLCCPARRDGNLAQRGADGNLALARRMGQKQTPG